MIYYVIDNDIDLVVKVIKCYDDFVLVIFMLIDWYLLCKCFSLVLLVKEYDWLEGG